ncbi:MAG: protein kinase, partial [Holophagales bacterium]|nr:protein kinase [Holophagales bacterium]
MRRHRQIGRGRQPRQIRSMTPEGPTSPDRGSGEAGFTEVDDWLDLALRRPAAERRAFLERQCHDEAVRARVIRMLEHLDRPADLLRSGAGLDAGLDAGLGKTLLGDPGLAESLPEMLGPFRIEKELGRGGMGVVYQARREGPGYQQRLALKVMRGMADTPLARRRFARERRILARLSHPHIARLLDGGHLEDDRPYLAMELVEGRPIDSYCNRERLRPRRRIELFLDVARAVAHAHRRLIVHRDIKAANILVDPEGEIRLLDFGIAALTDAPPAEQLTVAHHRPMSPAYASPEQLTKEPITTASDIYQLGLLLYGLVTGRWPYPREAFETDAAAATLRADAVPASRAAADTRSPTPDLPGLGFEPGVGNKRLRRWLRGDLDNILAMALRKEPERRYPSVEALIHDLEAFLESRPVAARADARGYRLAKWLRRHRLAVAAATSLLLSLMIAGTFHTLRLGEERDRARREALRAQHTADFLADLFLAADPASQGPEPPSVRELLDRGAAQLERSLGQEPLTRSRLQAQMADIYFSLGTYDRAEQLVRQAIQGLETTLGPSDPETLAARHRLATIWLENRRLPEAEALLRWLIEDRRRVLGPEDPATLDSKVILAAVLGPEGDGLDPEAELLLQNVLEAQRWRGSRERYPVADWLRLAEALMRLGDGRSCRIYRDLELHLSATLGPRHPQTSRVLYNLAVCRWHVEEKAEAAVEPLGRAVEGRLEALGATHPRTLEARRLLGWVLGDLGRHHAAETGLRRAVADQREAGLGGPRWIRTVGLRNNLTGRVTRLPMMCQHCEKAPCVDVCPTGASFQRADGLALV